MASEESDRLIWSEPVCALCCLLLQAPLLAPSPLGLGWLACGYWLLAAAPWTSPPSGCAPVSTYDKNCSGARTSLRQPLARLCEGAGRRPGAHTLSKVAPSTLPPGWNPPGDPPGRFKRQKPHVALTCICVHKYTLSRPDTSTTSGSLRELQLLGLF